MNIVVSADKKYIEPLKVLLYSIYSQNKNVNTYFINFSVAEDDLAELKLLTSKFTSCSFNNIMVPGSIKRMITGTPIAKTGINILKKMRLSIETFSRVISLAILPETLDRALYLDIDTIVKGDLSSFYNRDFEGKAVIGMNIYKDMKYETEYKEFLQSSFNAGVALFNLKKIREEKLVSTKNICDLINGTFESKNFCFDEYVLNTIFKDNILFEDYLKYNLPAEPKYLNKDIMTNKQKYIDNALIIHYIHSIKPWSAKSILNREFCEVWKSYAKQLSETYSDITVKELTHGSIRRK